AVQMRSGVDVEGSRAQAMPLLREAAMAGARLVATPEMTVRLDLNRARRNEALARADLVAEQRAWGRTAEELGVWILVGSVPVPADEGRVYNRSQLFAPDGRLAATYDKINLFDVTLGGTENYRESAGVAPGTRAVVTQGPMGVKLGLTICYDIRFAGLYRALARAGAEMIAAPAAFTVPTGRAHWETLLRARAIETGAFVIAPAQGGVHEDGRATWGHSMIVGPWGQVLKTLPGDDPGMIVADCDLDEVADARAKIPAWRDEAAFEAP
ncbi:MAG: carbon-nitrogen hydrolase family protein, partial [Hyphomonadaceae bacterium]|nr:carbon-nitrogen hydrolase family protein [Hyphomonadaceae bacterium]